MLNCKHNCTVVGKAYSAIHCNTLYLGYFVLRSPDLPLPPHYPYFRSACNFTTCTLYYHITRNIFLTNVFQFPQLQKFTVSLLSRSQDQCVSAIKGKLTRTTRFRCLFTEALQQTLYHHLLTSKPGGYGCFFSSHTQLVYSCSPPLRLKHSV